MEPTYMIPALLRELIEELLDPRANEENRGFYIEDVRKRYNETLMMLTPEQISNFNDYLTSLVGYITHSIEFLSNLKVDRPENPFDKIEDPEQNFIHHVLCDQQHKIASILSMMNVALEVVNIGKEELSDYLPVTFVSDDGEKKLNMTNGDINK